MNRRIFSVLAITAIVSAGCSSSSGNNPPDPVPPSAPPIPSASLRLLHASPDSPAVNIGGLPIVNLDYKQGTGTTVAAGTAEGLTVDGILPDGSTATVYAFDPIDLEADTLYTVIAIDDPATDLAVQPVLLVEPPTATPLAAGNTRLQVVHGAPDVGEVTVYLTAPDADLGTSPEVVTFSFGETTAEPVDVPSAGPYQIRITAGGNVAFDSGEIAALPDGANLVITAVENTTSADGINDDSPVSLIALTSSGATIEFLDVNSPAELRVVHASADTPAVDIIVNDDFMNPAVENLSFPNFAPEMGFLNLPAGTYDVSVVPTGTMNEAIDIDGLEVDAGVTYDVLAINELANVDALLAAADDFRRVETAAKVRIIHASTVADTVSPEGVDIYVTEVGADITDLDPAISNFEYETNTGFIQLTPGDYTVTVTAAGSKDAAIGPVDVGLEASGIYTFIARDPRPDVMDDPLGLIILDDAPAPVL